MTDMTGMGPTGAFPHRMDLGYLGNTTFRIIRAAPWLFVALACLPLVFAVPSALTEAQILKPNPSLTTLSSILLFVESIVQIVMQAAATYGAARLFVGAPCGLREAVSVASRRFLPYLGTSIVSGLIVAFCFLLLIVPGVIAICALAVAGPACMVERCGPIQSVNRSADLTKGNRWGVISAILLFIVVPGVAVAAIVGIASLVLGLVHLQVLGSLLFLPVEPLFSMIGVIMGAVLFFHLRAIKEGIGPEAALAKVFD